MNIPLTPKEIARQKAKAKEDERIRLEKQKVLREKQREKNRKRRKKERNSGNYDEILAQRRAKYAEKRNTEIAQAIAEGVAPPREYRPQKKYQSA